MRRRDVIALLGGAAVVWPLAARAQQRDRTRRIGMLWITSEADPQSIINREAFNRQLHQLGWRTGDNVHVDNRWAANDVSRQRAYVAELIGLSPDLLVAEGTPGLAAARQATRTIPIIFVNVTARLAKVSPRVWRIRAVTRRGSRSTSLQWVRNG